MRIPRAAVAATLAAPLLAACSGGGLDPEVARLRAKGEAQAAAIESLEGRLKQMEARSRLLEEQLGARAVPAGPAAAADAAKPAEGEAAAGPEPLTGAVAATAEAVGTFLDTEQGRMRIREAVAAEEKRRQDEARAQRREQSLTFIKERVSGSIAEALGLDAKQQQTVITIAADTMERMEEIWRGARDGQAGSQGFADARQKTQEVMQQAQKDLQQALTVDQYAKLQELNAEGNGLLPGRGMGGFGGGGFGGRGAGGGRDGGGGQPGPGAR